MGGGGGMRRGMRRLSCQSDLDSQLSSNMLKLLNSESFRQGNRIKHQCSFKCANTFSPLETLESDLITLTSAS